MPEQITLSVNGRNLSVPQGATVAAAVAMTNSFCRRSVSGEPRTVLCGMGICFECRVEIDGVPHQRSCQILCASGMRVKT
ncbi:MAG TPA: 2Fe-2S iron-sulfur cluster-binding protein [Terriglobales bacterium]|nr:2Fe-2S iron-sulfur cluster-binding protein [Terriglobales bacterium]